MAAVGTQGVPSLQDSPFMCLFCLLGSLVRPPHLSTAFFAALSAHNGRRMLTQQQAVIPGQTHILPVLLGFIDNSKWVDDSDLE